MGLFKRKKDKSPDVKDEKLEKSGELHDPILKAVHESQPFEDMANNHATEAITPSGALRDVFGNKILNPDMSNPARARDERPLDTIRTFEFSTTGDEQIRETMETQTLGFVPRQDFSSVPTFDTNPYSNNIISFGDPNAPPESTDTIQENEYFLKQETTTKKKKKRGLFGKKKNDD